MSRTVTLEVDASTALVLFEFLSRFETEDALRVDDQAEVVALWLLGGLLEKQLAEPLKPNYHELLAEARRELREKWGERAR